MTSSVSSSTLSQSQLLLLQQQQLASQNSLVADLGNTDTISSSSSGAPTIDTADATYQQTPIAQNFQQLVQAVQSGDLSAAQEAYSNLTQLTTSTGYSQNGAAVASGNGFAQTLSQIGSDLQANNVNGAQQALSSLRGSSHGGGTRGGGAGGTAAASPASSTIQTGTVTTINPDGSTTVTTTDANGNVIVTTQQAKPTLTSALTV